MDDYRNSINDGSLPLGSISPGGSIVGSVETESDKDTFAVSLLRGQTYKFDLISQAGGTLNNGTLTLYDSAGSYLASASGFSGTAAHFLYTATADGTYYLIGGGAYSTDLGNYDLSVSAGIVDDFRDRFDDTLEPLGAISPGSSKTGVVETESDKDTFSIDLVAGQTYNFDLISQAGGTLNNGTLTLYDSTGSYLASASGFSGSAAHFLYTATADGTYYLTGGGAYSTDLGSYDLSVSAGIVDDFRDRFDDVLEPLGAISPGSSKTGVVETAGDKDVFAVSLVGGQTYNFDLKELAGGTLDDTSLTLLDASGSYVTSASGFSGTATHFIYTPAANGSFFLSASGAYSTNLGGYTLSVTNSFTDDYRDTYNDASEALGQIAAGATRSGVVEIGGDKDVFAIALTAGQTYSFDLKEKAGGTLDDVALTLLSSIGGYLASASNFDGATAHFLYTAATTGTYYLSATGAYSTNLGDYSVSVSNGFVDDYRDRYDDASEKLGAIALGGSKSGNIETQSDRDVFAITLTAGHSYSFDLKAQAGSQIKDVALGLLSSIGGALKSDVGLSNAAAHFDFTATTTGTYYLSASGGYSTSLGGYLLTVGNGSASDDYRNSYNASGLPLGRSTIGGSSAGTIERAGDKDIFAVTLAAGQSYTFDLSGELGSSLANPELKLLNGVGALLLTNNDFNGANSHIVFTAKTAGTYYLDAHSATAAGVGNYFLTTKQNYDDYRDTRVDATGPLGSLPGKGSCLGTIEKVGDHDFISITLVAGQNYTFDLSGASSWSSALGNPELRLLNNAGGILLTNNDYNSLSSRLIYTASIGGTYYLDVHGAANKGIGGYLLSSRINFDDYRDGKADGSSALGSLASNGTELGAIEKSGDKDFFAVSLRAGHSYTFDVHGSAQGTYALGNSELRLLNSAGTLLIVNNDFNSFGSRIVYTAATNGTYYLDVHSFTTSGTGGYLLSERVDFDDFRDAKTDTTAALGGLTLNRAQLGTIETAGDEDVFIFNVQKGKQYNLDLDVGAKGGQLHDGDIQILGAGGAILAYNDNSGGTHDAHITFTANQTGTLYADVGGVSTATGFYSIELSVIA